MKSIMKTKNALCALAFALSLPWAQGAEQGFRSLFNGRDLSGWAGNPSLWSVRDGAITGQTTADYPTHQNTFLVWKGGRVRDFELRFRYRILPNNERGFANSGLQYRSSLLDCENWVVGGYQADFEAGDRFSGILYEERGRGILADRGQMTWIQPDGKIRVVGSLGASKEIQSVIKPKDWNDYTVIARGNHLTHVINSRVTVDVVDDQANKASKSGILAFQLHAGPPMTVQIKDVRLRELSKTRKVVFIAGHGSHSRGAHEHWAGLLLLKKCLANVPDLEISLHYLWPKDPSVLQDADAIVIYADGGAGHPALQGDHLKQLAAAIARGAGFGCIHYAVEVPKNHGGKEFLDWLGGYFETYWSVNPFWEAQFKSFPDHPVARGLKPFKILDEWYYHMRFQPGMKGVTPILSALPPPSTLKRRDGPHENNPYVRKEVLEQKKPQHVMWVYERPDGGRGFGFTGGHSHKNWAEDNFRKAVLNAILWIAHMDVPPNGVASKVTEKDIEETLNAPIPKR